MKNTIQRTISFLGIALMATQLIAANTANSNVNQTSSAAFEQAMPATPAQKEVQDLLKRIHSNAATATRHAETLQSLAPGTPKLLYGSHVDEITSVKEAVNDMSADLQRLRELRPDALPWQQSVIDRMEPLLIGLAGHTTQAIERLNEDRYKVTSDNYRDAIENVYAYAGQTRKLVSVNLDYAQSREKLNRLDASIEGVLANASVRDVTPSSSKASKSLEQRVKSALLNLPYYGVFDYLAFRIDQDKVTLTGHVSWPTLKADAEQAVRGVEGVEAVASAIEVLPLSPHDDGIRVAAYHAIYGHSALAQYSLNPQPPIRIIVKNGHLTLMGVVGSEMHRTITNMQANGVPGVFSVTNNLEIGS